MGFTYEFSSGSSAYVTFDKGSGALSKKSFIIDIEDLFKNYVNMNRVKMLTVRMTNPVKRYKFIESYEDTGKEIEETFLQTRGIREIDYLDRTAIALSYFSVLHSICRIPVMHYNSIFERSSSYSDFIKIYMAYLNDWIVGKSIENDARALMSEISANIEIMDEVLSRDINVHSVFEIYPAVGKGSEPTGYSNIIMGAGILLLIAVIVIIFMYFRRSGK